MFKKFKVSKDTSNSIHGVSSEGSSVEGGAVSARRAMLDDRHRRRFFSHYDIGSLCATLNLSSMLKSIDRISNSQTGASAASAALRGVDDTNNEDVDHGDQVSNTLVLR